LKLITALVGLGKKSEAPAGVRTLTGSGGTVGAVNTGGFVTDEL
jgi:hypothetical protein